MAFAKGHHPGAVWHKADLQCHTPRDHGWSGSPDLPGGSDEGEAARLAWAASFIAACKEKGLKAVAITDHHDACMVEYVHRHLLEISENDVKVFAGVEITCNDAVQAIALFDSGSNQRDWEKLLSKLGNVTPSALADAKTCPTEICGFSIKDLFDTIYGDKRLSEICLLIPHLEIHPPTSL